MSSRAEEMLQSLRSGRSRNIPYAATQARYVDRSKIPVVLRTKRNRDGSEEAEAPLTGGVTMFQSSPLPTKSAILTDVVMDEGKPPVALDMGMMESDVPGATKSIKVDLEDYSGDESSESESESDSDSDSETDSDSDSETDSYISDSESESSELHASDVDTSDLLDTSDLESLDYTDSSDLDSGTEGDSESNEDEGYGHRKTKPRKPCFLASPVRRCAGFPVRIDILVDQFVGLGVSSKPQSYSIPTLNPFITHVRNEDSYKMENLMFQSHCVKLDRIYMYAPDYEYSSYKAAFNDYLVNAPTGQATPNRSRLGKRKRSEEDQDDSDMKTQPKKQQIGHDSSYKTLKEHVRLFEESLNPKRKRKQAEVDSEDDQNCQVKRCPITVQNCSSTCSIVKVPVKMSKDSSKLQSKRPRKRKQAEDDNEDDEIFQVKRRHLQEEINSMLTAIRSKVEQGKKKG